MAGEQHEPGHEPRERVDLALRRFVHALEQVEAAARSGSGMTASEQRVLLLVADGVTAPSELARRVAMTTAGMTNLLDRLEASQYLRRVPHPHDGRRVLVSLTKQGLRLAGALAGPALALDELARSMGPDAHAHVLRFLGEAARLVEEHAADRGRPSS